GQLLNYDGASFSTILVEEFLAGVEFSVQGLVRDATVDVLSCCEKIIAAEPDRADPSLTGFRERAHLAVPGVRMPGDVGRLVEGCVAAFGYRDGPFHIDLIRSRGALFFIEMGFRLSGGGLVSLVEHVTGQNWADQSFDW